MDDITKKGDDFLAAESHQVDLLKKQFLDEDVLLDLAELFKIFGDSNRIRILYALSGVELCVSDIATLLGLSPSAVSHQLRILKTSKLVKCRRDGKIIFYMLSDDHVKEIINLGVEHIIE